MDGFQKQRWLVQPIDQVACEHQIIPGELRWQIAGVALMKGHTVSGLFQPERRETLVLEGHQLALFRTGITHAFVPGYFLTLVDERVGKIDAVHVPEMPGQLKAGTANGAADIQRTIQGSAIHGIHGGIRQRLGEVGLTMPPFTKVKFQILGEGGVVFIIRGLLQWNSPTLNGSTATSSVTGSCQYPDQ